jgi:hypothetical protein
MLSVIFLCVAIKEREKEKELTQRIYGPQIHKVSAENKRKATDEVLPRQCPYSRAFDSWNALWDLANSTASDRNRGCTRIYPGSPPRRVKTYILLV